MKTFTPFTPIHDPASYQREKARARRLSNEQDLAFLATLTDLQSAQKELDRRNKALDRLEQQQSKQQAKPQDNPFTVTVEGWGSARKPLDHLEYHLMLNNWTWAQSPVDLRNAQRRQALDGLQNADGSYVKDREPMPKSYVDQLFPEPEKDRDVLHRQQVHNLWTNDTPLYSAKHIYRLTSKSSQYATWRAMHNLDDNLLTVRQLYWLLETARNSSKFKFTQPLPSIDWKNYIHPFPVGHEQRKTQSRIGKQYKNWKFLACQSESEASTNNRAVLYQVQCSTCSIILDKFNYRRIGSGCSNCARIARQSKQDEAAKYLDQPVTIYLLANNSMHVSHVQPIDAVAVAKFEKYDTDTPWTYLSEQAKQVAQNLPEREIPEPPKDTNVRPDDVMRLDDIPDF